MQAIDLNSAWAFANKMLALPDVQNIVENVKRDREDYEDYDDYKEIIDDVMDIVYYREYDNCRKDVHNEPSLPTNFRYPHWTTNNWNHNLWFEPDGKAPTGRMTARVSLQLDVPYIETQYRTLIHTLSNHLCQLSDQAMKSDGNLYIKWKYGDEKGLKNRIDDIVIYIYHNDANTKSDEIGKEIYSKLPKFLLAKSAGIPGMVTVKSGIYRAQECVGGSITWYSDLLEEAITIGQQSHGMSLATSLALAIIDGYDGRFNTKGFVKWIAEKKFRQAFNMFRGISTVTHVMSPVRNIITRAMHVTKTKSGAYEV